MDLINLLAENISEQVKISPLAARGLFKLAIKEEVGPFKPLNTLSYEKFERVIKNSLKKRLEGLKVANIDSIIANLIIILTKNQSLITMEAV